MKLNELTRNIEIWRSREEQEVLDTISEPRPLATFKEREQAIIEGLIRKSLLIKVQGKHSSYVYPNV
jgi:hypothetical protein